MNLHEGKRTVLQLCLTFGVVVLLAVYPAYLYLAQKIYGGPHVTLAGEAYGFKIGMAKKDVFDTYKALNESGNLRTIKPDGTESSPVALEPSELLMTPELESSDHWMGYRRKEHIYYQEFFFSSGKLTNLTTYIRFYEMP